jgi:SAM-dependent methyltransferase
MSLASRLRPLLLRAGETWRDWRDGLDTAGRVAAPDIVTGSANKARGIRYQPTPLAPLRAVLRTLQLPPGRTFVDIGAGKGRVLLAARELPFARVIGVEYSEPLCAIARRNLAVAQRRAPGGPPVEIRCCDAADYRFEPGEDVIYLFNPFDAVVLARLLDNLHASLQRAPRPLWLVYHFPRWHAVVTATGWLRPHAMHCYGAHEFAVFRHEPAGAAGPDAADGVKLQQACEGAG